MLYYILKRVCFVELPSLFLHGGQLAKVNTHRYVWLEALALDFRAITVITISRWKQYEPPQFSIKLQRPSLLRTRLLRKLSSKSLLVLRHDLHFFQRAKKAFPGRDASFDTHLRI